jgi:isoleucyl-tRNA synthetase
MHEGRGYAAEGQAGEFAILETTLTPELILEGQAREFVHQIQTLRKDAGLAVDDRIVLYYDGPLASLLATHGDHVARETLAAAVQAGLREGLVTRDLRLDDLRVRVGIARAPKDRDRGPGTRDRRKQHTL